MNTFELVSTIGLFAAAGFKFIPSINRIILAMQQIKFSSSILSSIKEIQNYIKNDLKKVNDNLYIDHIDKFEKIEFQKSLIGDINIDLLISQSAQRKLYAKDIMSIDDIEGKKQIVWFVPIKSEVKQTKTKKNFLLMEVVGACGKTYQIRCWNWNTSQSININTPYISEVEVNDFGISTRIAKLKSLGNLQ
jgi:hypothetical protein